MKKLCLLSALLLLILAMIGLSACGNDRDDEDEDEDDEGIIVTYYLTEGGTPIKVSIYNGVFNLAKKPARTGYTFLGLYDSPSGGVMVVDEKGKCQTVITAPITLYAQWEAKSYTIELDPKNASLSSTDKTMTVEYGTKITELPVLTLQGYDFVGWKNADGKMISDGGIVRESFQAFTAENYAIEDDKACLTAVFTVRRLTVTFNYNNGTGRTETLKLDYGTMLTESHYPPKSEYTDTGSSEIVTWSASQNNGAAFTGEITESIELYAVWKNYRVAGLDDGEGNQQQIRVYEGEPFDLKSYDGMDRPGKSVVGWYETKHLGGAPVETVTYGMVTSGTVYYAMWGEALYTLTFDSETAGEYFPPKEYKYGDSFDLPTLSKTGHTFLGWCRTPELSDTPITRITSSDWKSYTLYAKFEPYSFTVVLMPEKGTVSANTVTVQYLQHYRLPIPEREGSTFLGWYDAPQGGRQYAGPTGSSTGPYGQLQGITLYAQWEVQTLQVTYNSAGGTEVPAQTYEYGDKLEFPKAPTKSGYYFSGWYHKDLVTPYDTNVTLTQGIELYAKWGKKDMSASYQKSTFKSILDGASEFNGNYYKVIPVNTSWATAKAFCEGVGGHLVTITTKEENAFVYQIMKSAGYNCAHLGATDAKTEGVWEWVTGEKWDFQCWAKNEPDGGTRENYMGFAHNNPNAEWIDVGSNYVFICEWESSSVDYVRENYGTVTSTEPNYNNSFYYAGHLYKVFKYDYDYARAKSYCQEIGGHLADIGGEKENLALFTYIVENNAWDAMFGISDADNEGTWISAATGKKATYLNWSAEQPDNAGSKEHYAHFWSSSADGKWNDATWKNVFICEWDYWECNA